MKIFLRANRRRSNGEQPGTKSGHRHAVKPLVNWSPTGLLPVVVFFGSVYMGFNPIVVPKVHPGRMSSSFWAVLPWPNCFAAALPRSARHASPQTTPHGAACGMSGFFNFANKCELFPDMPCMKRVYRDKKASFH